MKPRGYQEEAIGLALEHDGYGLFMEQRTGKTLVAIKIIDAREPDRLLIVSTLKGVAEWNRQMKAYGKLKAKEIRLINFEQLWTQRRELRKWINVPRSMMVIDESHRIKRKGSKFSKAARSIAWTRPKKKPPRARAKFRLAMTGTPIAQGIQDAWAQFDFIDPALFGKWVRFEDKYLEYGGFKGKKIVGYKDLDEFNEIYHAHSYRKTLKEAKQEAGLKPAKIRIRELRFKLSLAIQVAYDELEEELITEVNKKRVSAPNVIACAMKLHQLTGGFLKTYHEAKIPAHYQKVRELQELLVSWPSRRKTVVCARFLNEVEEIQKVFKRLHWSVKTIQGGVEFDGRFDTDAIILQIQSGVAIDLSAADSIIFFSWDYSYINYEQTKFRVLSYEKGQVNYYYLIADGTIDEKIYEAITRKKDFATLICDHYRRKRHGR